MMGNRGGRALAVTMMMMMIMMIILVMMTMVRFFDPKGPLT